MICIITDFSLLVYSCHYFSSPGLSWDAIIKIRSIKLDLTLYYGVTYSTKVE